MYSTSAAKIFWKRDKNEPGFESSEIRAKAAISCTSIRALRASFSKVFGEEGVAGEQESTEVEEGDGAGESKDMMISREAFFSDADFFFGRLCL